jgi:hypothetical protein
MASDALGIGSRVRHPAYGDGVVIRLHKVAYEISFIQYGIKMVGRDYESLEITERIEPQEVVSFTEAEKALVKILRAYNGVEEEVALGDKWDGGMLVLQPKDDHYKDKEIPIDVFFHEIVMVRDRLRVLEQRINSNKQLSDEEKVNLQQYITRIYGSLTSFNVLFKHKEDYFVGEKSS